MKDHLVYSILDVVRKDLATSAGNDRVSDYHYAQLAKQMQSGHWAFEIGLKTLIEKSQGKCKAWGHDLFDLYSKLGCVNVKAFDDLNRVYSDTVDFYRCDDLEEDLSGHLARVGSKEVFVRLRYAALDKPAVAFVDVPLSQVYFELLAVLRDYEAIGLRTRHLPSLRIDQQVEDAVVRAVEGDPEEFERREEAWTWLCNKIESDNLAWRDLLHRARQQGFKLEGAPNDRVETLLSEAYSTLTSQERNSEVNPDPALDYYLRRIEYVPSGAEQNNCTLEPVLSGGAENDVVAQVCSPSGESLGLIERLSDGAWVANLSGGRHVVFETKDDAALYLVRVGTRTLRRYVNEGEHEDLRIVQDIDWFLEPVGRRRNVWETKLVFWDECPLEVGDQLEAALLPFDDEHKSVLRIETQVVSCTEHNCVVRGGWFADVRRSTEY